MTSWIRRFLRLASQVLGEEGPQWLRWSLFAVLVVLIPFLYLDSREHLGALGTVVTLSFLALMAGIAWARWNWVLWTIAILIVLAIGGTFSWTYWEDLHSDQDSVSTTLRNLGLLIGGVIAIILAVWRSKVAEGQADTAQQSLLNERHQQGAEMLGSEILSVRLGGIYALWRLAEEHPEEYHIQIMELLCAFARHPAGYDSTVDSQGEVTTRGEAGEREWNTLPRLREDVQAVMAKIGNRNERGLRLEHGKGYRLNLRGVDLSGASLPDANLSGADLTYAKLSGANLWSANLSRATLWNADLSLQPSSHEDVNFAIMSAIYKDQESQGTIMIGSDLSDAVLSGADLSNVVMPYANLAGAQLYATTLCGSDLSQAFFSVNGQRPAKGVTQADLDKACADASGGPNLEGATDAETGEPLVWHDKPCQ